MQTIDLESQRFRDQVLGCWVGKNAGGTLGAPLEKQYGEREPFDVTWYPKLLPGGVPNDDLELQLIWLKALEQGGPHLDAHDLARYWLDHVGYNWDEYGLHVTNLRLGLLPPVSSWHNNWFKDCMGCPIRSEIWACVAPGQPRLAARYAYADAIVDHAGGEGVWGEAFNAAMQSAAFVEPDVHRLLDIGRSYVRDGTRTAATIDAARAAFARGDDWRTARRRVMDAAPNDNAMYAPINMGFQVVGLLWGTDFADAICKTVNCGYDTDCTAATVGALLGILSGAASLPAKWVEPLGDAIATNESNGGLRDLSSGGWDVPRTCAALTDRVIAVARRVMAGRTVDRDAFDCDAETRALFDAPPSRVDYRFPALDVGIDYAHGAAVRPDEVNPVHVRFTNRGASPLRATYVLRVPDGRSGEPSGVDVPAFGATEVLVPITAPGPGAIAHANRYALGVEVAGRPAIGAVPITLVGATAFRVLGPLTPPNGNDPLDLPMPPETTAGDPLRPTARTGEWRTRYALDDRIPLDKADDATCHGNRIHFVQLFLQAERAEQARIGVPANASTKVWLNGEVVLRVAEPRRVRPNYDGDGKSYFDRPLARGWNELLIKLVRAPGGPPLEAFVTVADCRHHTRGFVELVRTRFPWDDGRIQKATS